MNKYDVIIVGAGPAGATAALYANRSNLKCLLIDKSVFPRDKVCGDALSGKSVKLLDELGFIDDINKLSDFTRETLEPIINGLIKNNNTNFKGVVQPLRISLTGSKFGPGIYDILCALGKEEVSKRLSQIR